MKTLAKIRLISIAILLLFEFGAMAQQPALQYFRPYDQRGINVFETTKVDTVGFDGLKVRIGAGFTQNYQSLNHSTKAESTPAIELYGMSGGFALAQANFNIDAQLADGVSLNLVSYLSSHHHNEFWVKGGYLQIDKVGFLRSELLNNIWKDLTLKVGHMEVNYGDAHFRRSDGGNTMWNPWVENNIMDEFSTEIGAELYWQKNGIITMIGLTDGEIKGDISDPTAKEEKRKPSILAKIGYDKQLKDNLRVRLTGSLYTTKSSASNSLFGGDRTGSNYQYVMEVSNPAPSLTGNAFSGRFNPGYRDNLTAFMVNPFVKFSGLEVFGTWEYAYGKNQLENGEKGSTWGSSDYTNRQTHQAAVEALYRFGKNESVYIGARYNKVTSNLAFGQSATNPGTLYNISIDRTSVGAGWFITKNILFKGEYVNQNYSGYPTTDKFYGGNFKGLVVQGVIAF